MTTAANYAATPISSVGRTTTADASLSQPTTATVGVVVTAPSTGARIDNLDSVSQGTSVAGLFRLFVCEGTPGAGVISITSSGAVATVTTTAVGTLPAAHGLITGDLVTHFGHFPVEYNAVNVPVTVLSPTTYTYPITAIGGVLAVRIGGYSSTRAVPSYQLLGEFPIVATVGSSTARAFNHSLDSLTNSDFMPIILPPGYSLRTTVSVTQTNAIQTVARGGSF